MNRIAAALAVLSLLGFSTRAHAVDIVGKAMMLPASERAVQVTYFRAPGQEPRPSVLLLHGAIGFESEIANYTRYASDLANSGIDAYLVYYYSEADEQARASGRNVFQTRYDAWVKLADDLADHLVKQPNSNGKVGLIGFSLGAMITAAASARDPAISAAVIYYGTLPAAEESSVTRFPPLLFLHGDADTVIPLERGRHLADLARKLGAPVEFQVYPGAHHGFGALLQTPAGSDAETRAIAFLGRELKTY